MRLRHRLASPWLTAFLAVVLLAIGGAVALAVGAVKLPPFTLSFDPFATTGGPAAVASPTAIPSPTGPTPDPTFVRPTPSPAPTFLSYRVGVGETLTSIAKKLHTT